MATASQKRLYRILAGSLALGAGGLAAWYHLAHKPLADKVEATAAEVRALTAQAAAANDTPDEPETTPEPANHTPDDTTQARAEACATLQELVEAFPQEANANASRFAVEELLRSTRTRHAELSDDTVATAGILSTHTLQIALDGETRYIQQLIGNLIEYENAGFIADITLDTPPIPDDESSSERRRREARGPQLQGSIELRTDFVERSNALLQEHCPTPED